MKCCKFFLIKIVTAFLFFNYSAFSEITIQNTDSIDSKNSIKNWEFFETDNLRIKEFDFPSSNIIFNSIYLDPESFEAKKINGIVWFRKKITFPDSLKDRSFSLAIEINGAAEIYIDQKLVEKFGTVSKNGKDEKLVSSLIQRVFYPFIPGKEYLVAIRYSNHNVNESFNTKGEKVVGLNIKLEESKDLFQNIFTQSITAVAIGIIISMFFFTLSFVHFIIFMFYRQEKANIYYAFFCLTASAIAASTVLRIVSYFADLTNVFSLIVALSPALIFTLLPFMIRSFFKLKFPKWYYFFVFLFLIIIFLIFFSFPFWGVVYYVLVAVSVIETIRAIIIAVKNKIKGVKIIGIGTSFFLLLIVTILIFIVLGISGTTNNFSLGMFFVLLILLSIFSIPVSITIFLSYQISLTNRSLSQKLIEVEDLSKQTIEQEKEKQKILENQKGLLEEQVTERTIEITEQKKIIEEKNKDIVDSINYAKRIQTAILPEPNFFKSVFERSFLIYQPRDIVSGDFYYVTEIENLKVLFIADCTGHGVPGALMSMVGSNLIHKIIHENRIFQPKEILQTLHIELRQALKQDQQGSENRDGMDVAIVVIDKEQLFFSGANRPLLYFNSNNELTEVKPTKTPIGGSHIESVDIAQHSFSKKEIKEFYLFSDGFADQFGGIGLSDKSSAGKKLMVSKFKSWLEQIFELSLPEKETYLKTEFEKWKGNLEQVDDVMVIGIQPFNE